MISRNNFLSNKILMLDGLIGGGKGLISGCMPYFKGVESYLAKPEIEQICFLSYIKNISFDSACGLIKTWCDQESYKSSLLRHSNFRIYDDSSVIRHPNKFEFIKRFLTSDSLKLEKEFIENRKILNIMLHNTTPYAEPIFSALEDRLVFVRVNRSPVTSYMINHISNWTERWVNDYKNPMLTRSVRFNNKDELVPFFIDDYEEYLSANKLERAVLSIIHWIDEGNTFIDNAKIKYKSTVIEIPFEKFVLDPDPFLEDISEALGRKLLHSFKSHLRKQKLPRKFLTDAPYHRYFYKMGWREPDKKLTPKLELIRDQESIGLKISNEIFHKLVACNERYYKRYELETFLN